MPIFVVRADTGVGTHIWGGSPAIARSSDGRLWCPYLREIAGIRQICVSYSDDGGSAWVEEQVTVGVDHQGTPRIAIDSADNVHLIWNDDVAVGRGGNIHYCKRTGVGWGAIENVTNWPTPIPMNEQYAPRLAIDSADNVHAVWHGYGYGAWPTTTSCQYRQRTAVGWQPQEMIAEHYQTNPHIAIDSTDIIHVIWTGLGWLVDPTIRSVEYRQRTAVGWQPQESVTTILEHNYSGDIILDQSDNAYTVFYGYGWGANPGLRNIQYIQRIAGVWGGQEAVTDYVNDQQSSRMALDTEGSVHVFWVGRGWGTYPLRRNIQYRKRTAAGWQPQVAVTDRNLDQWNPHCLWANYPIVGGLKPNIPQAGCAMVFAGKLATKLNITTLLVCVGGHLLR